MSARQSLERPAKAVRRADVEQDAVREADANHLHAAGAGCVEDMTDDRLRPITLLVVPGATEVGERRRPARDAPAVAQRGVLGFVEYLLNGSVWPELDGTHAFWFLDWEDAE